MLGAQTSTTHSNYAEAHLKKAELKLYPTADEYKLDLANGRVDAVIDDVVVLSEWLKTRGRRLLQDPDGTLPVDRKSMAKAPALPSARANRCAKSSTRRSRRSAPTANTRKSTTSTSTSTFTANNKFVYIADKC